MKKKRLPIIIFIVGLVALLGGAGYLIFKIVKQPDLRDAEYLVNAGDWVKEDAEGVIWDFTEVGKGTLTTNNHVNDYDFLWSMDGSTLKIETKWLYDLEDEYTYSINRGAKTLTLTSGEKTITFKAVEKAEEPAEKTE
ncbi:MAG: DUF5640 domain-containing protein [Candidatus Saccharibacteria bacterium]|nr:DUF5640 domain-containing protein [Candidatus Saccharibacteria bacterium]